MPLAICPKIMARYEEAAASLDDCCRLMLLNRPYSMQLTEQIPNDPPRMGARSTTTSNHSSTLCFILKYVSVVKITGESIKTIEGKAYRLKTLISLSVRITFTYVNNITFNNSTKLF